MYLAFIITTSARFTQQPLELISNPTFTEDFKKLYKYYKNTQFVKFAVIGTHLFMVFRVGKGVNDIKTFKWLVKDGTLTYLDNRSDHEFVFPNQHDFTWKRTVREAQRKGKYPHISIEDKVFVETIHGDLTIKVEDNTDSGQGIYSEPVEDKDQTLDDSEIYYAIIGNIILLKIRPYRENNYRYLVFNAKLREVRRIDALADCGVFLPNDQGIIYAYGYYLQTGEFKQFDNGLSDMLFEKRIAVAERRGFPVRVLQQGNRRLPAPVLQPHHPENREPDYLPRLRAVRERRALLFPGRRGSRRNTTPSKSGRRLTSAAIFRFRLRKDSYLYKVGNKDIVRAMAESNEILTLLQKEDSYTNLYLDLIKKTTDILDSYHWLNQRGNL